MLKGCAEWPNVCGCNSFFHISIALNNNTGNVRLLTNGKVVAAFDNVKDFYVKFVVQISSMLKTHNNFISELGILQVK